MRSSRNVLNQIFLRHFANSTATSVSRAQVSSADTQVVAENVLPVEDLRRQYAPWIPIGDFKKGLLSHLSGPDIVRALSVLRLCSYNFVVDRSLQMFHMSQKFGPLGEWILRKTFFDQFVGGDTVSRMTVVVQTLQRRGLTLMVVPVLEEDVEDVKSNKNKYDNNLNSLMDIATLTSSLENRKPILQLKLSAIIPANTLEQVSRAIERTNGITASLIVEIANAIESPGELNLKINFIDKTYFLDGLKRADVLVKHAKELNTHVLIDAEFYACKPAISAMALALIARHNGSGHIVGNTIQGYLKDAVSTITSELDLITKEIGVNWYGKIVRGAYVDRERYLANKGGYPSPVCDTYEDTSSSYNKILQHVLEHLAQNKGKSHLVVATHNEKSIRLAAQKMKDLEISPENNSVSFAQIYGMADYLSTPLVQQGYKVYKSTPYGPIGSVIPYLARRASENRSVMLGAREERLMLWKELMSRLNFS